jgi:hypothetical protein
MRIYFKSQKRYLTDEEIENNFYFTGEIDRSYPDPHEYYDTFELVKDKKNNLRVYTFNYLTGKLNIDRRFRIEGIIVNKAACKNCGDILESKHRHNFVVCKCFAESDNLIQNYKSKKYLKDGFSWTKKYTDYVHSMHGIAIDGGLDYLSRSYYQQKDLIELSEFGERE